MSLPDFSLRRPVFATVMSILIVFFGVVGYTFLGVREYPAIDPPNITVRTNYTGANAEVIESQVTEPLERAINGIAGIRTISSASALGNSNITVEELAAHFLATLLATPAIVALPLLAMEIKVSSGPGQWAGASWRRT